MDLLTALSIICFIHCVFFFFNTIFKSCCHYPYLTLLKRSGLEVNFMVFKFFTTSMNRTLQKYGSGRPRCLDLWFRGGTVISLMLLPVAIIIIARSLLLELLRKSSSDVSSNAILEPVIPGYNLPISDLGFYALTLLICTFVHEIGHAVAAVREDVHIYGIGFFLIVCLPAACVYLDSNQLNSLAPLRKLHILCAGVWHNIFVAVVAILCLYSLPLVLKPGFITGDGVSVISILPDSAVQGPNGLRNKDVITSLNNCTVTDTITWKKCLLEALRNPSPGYCVSAEFVRENDESIPGYPVVGGGVECCSKEAMVLGRLCFQVVDDSGGPVELPEHSCLSARELINNDCDFCTAQSLPSCKSNLHCLRPSVGNQTKLIVMKRTKGQVVLFLGSPVEVYQAVTVTDFVPRWNVYDPVVPLVFEKCFKYLYMISSGLAVVNILPVFFFDGQHIAHALCDLLLLNYVKDGSMRLAISLCITVLGSLLLLLAIITPFIMQYV